MPEYEDVGGRLFVKLFCTFFLIPLTLRILFVLQQIHASRRRQAKTTTNANVNQQQQQLSPQQQPIKQQFKKYPIKTMIVLGSGGHTTEMLRMTQSLDARYYHPLVYVKASTDTTSLVRLQQQLQESSSSSTSNNNKNLDDDDNNAKKQPSSNTIMIHDIPRSREVGQSYASSILSTLHAAGYAFALVSRERPSLILTNGPGTCVPLVLAALVGRIFGYMSNTRTVFCESYCRVQTLSLTGKVLFYIADVFLVHWEELHQQYSETTVLVHTFNNTSKKE